MKTKTIFIVIMVVAIAYFGYNHFKKKEESKKVADLKKEDSLQASLDPKERYAGDQYEGNELSDMLK